MEKRARSLKVVITAFEEPSISATERRPREYVVLVCVCCHSMDLPGEDPGHDAEVC